MGGHMARFLSIVQDAKTRIREIGIADVRRRQDEGQRFFLVDVREESEWGRMRLPSAVHIARGVLERDIEQKIPDTEAPLVLYCGGGFRSALAADNLQKMGYTNVYSMAGGIRGWVEAGFPVETGEQR